MPDVASLPSTQVNISLFHFLPLRACTAKPGARCSLAATTMPPQAPRQKVSLLLPLLRMRTANGLPTTCWSPTTAIVMSSFVGIPSLAWVETSSTRTPMIAVAESARFMDTQFTAKRNSLHAQSTGAILTLGRHASCLRCGVRDNLDAQFPAARPVKFREENPLPAAQREPSGDDPHRF